MNGLVRDEKKELQGRTQWRDIWEEIVGSIRSRRKDRVCRPDTTKMWSCEV